ncbi:hypothetical protein [Leptolyngbya sp. PCC 6406]|nr:hypothetical protein [Leptolyngbya sp. PCC 6406]
MKLQDYFSILAPDDIRISSTRIGIEHFLIAKFLEQRPDLLRR